MRKIAALLICGFLFVPQIIDFKYMKKNNQIIVIFRQQTGYVYPEDGGPPDKVWKEIYGVKDGKIVLLKTVEGKHVPAQWVEEKIILDELE